MQDERERVGWFPLNRRSSRLMHLAAGDKIAGSIQLRVQWIHSLGAFLRCRVHGLEVGGELRVPWQRSGGCAVPLILWSLSRACQSPRM